MDQVHLFIQVIWSLLSGSCGFPDQTNKTGSICFLKWYLAVCTCYFKMYICSKDDLLLEIFSEHIILGDFVLRKIYVIEPVRLVLIVGSKFPSVHNTIESILQVRYTIYGNINVKNSLE